LVGLGLVVGVEGDAGWAALVGFFVGDAVGVDWPVVVELSLGLGSGLFPPSGAAEDDRPRKLAMDLLVM
jgi:hypothetical protein